MFFFTGIAHSSVSHLFMHTNSSIFFPVCGFFSCTPFLSVFHLVTTGSAINIQFLRFIDKKKL